MAITEADLAGFSNEKLQFIVNNGDPSGQLYGLAKSLLAKGSKSRNLEQAKAEEGRAAESQWKAKHPYLSAAGEALSGIGSDIKAGAKRLATPSGALDQVAGTVAAGLSSIPGYMPAMEAAGELSDTLGLGGQYNVLPRPGQTASTIESSPFPTIAKTVGAAIPGLGAAGKLGKTAQAASAAALKPMTSVYEAAAGPAPGAIRSTLAGAGAAGTVAANEAVIRRIPKLVTGQEVSPVSAEEVAMPVLVGGAISAVPGLASTIRSNKSLGGIRARNYTEARESGMFKDPEMKALPKGQLGMEEAAKVAKNRTEGAAVELEREFQMRHGAAGKKWMGETDESGNFRPGRYGRAFEAIRAKGETTDPMRTLGAIDDVIARKSSESATAGEGIQPEAARLSLAENLSRLREDLSRFLGPRATVRDYKNAIDEVRRLSQQGRSSDVVTGAYQEIENILRRDAYEAFPGFKRLSAKHRKFQTNQERAASIASGKAENKLGDGDPLEASREARGQAFWKRTGKGGPAADAAAEELEAVAPYTRPLVERARTTQAGADKFLEAKDALEASRFPAGYAAGAAAHPPLAGAMGLEHAMKYGAITKGMSLIPRVLQPMRSRAAYYLPETGSLRLSLPPTLQAAVTLNSPQAGADLVEAARQHAKGAEGALRRNNLLP